MKRHSTATLMGMTKKELVEYVRMVEHNQEVAEAALEQQAQNIKDWEPVRPELRKAVRRLNAQYERSKNAPCVRNPVAHALYRVWKVADSGEE